MYSNFISYSAGGLTSLIGLDYGPQSIGPTGLHPCRLLDFSQSLVKGGSRCRLSNKPTKGSLRPQARPVFLNF